MELPLPLNDCFGLIFLHNVYFRYTKKVLEQIFAIFIFPLFYRFFVKIGYKNGDTPFLHAKYTKIHYFIIFQIGLIAQKMQI